jgi:hypothetical protein
MHRDAIAPTCTPDFDKNGWTSHLAAATNNAASHARVSLLHRNASTRFIRVVYERKRRNGDLHNAMHYATINMRGAESKRRRTHRGARQSKFRNLFPRRSTRRGNPRALHLHSRLADPDRSRFTSRRRAGINKATLSATVRAIALR